MVVYASRSRTDFSPRRAVEPEAEFYERIAGPFWDQVRETIGEWWSHLPEHAQPSFRSRLLDRNSDTNVSSALWELYLHEMLLGSGCTVEVEQEIGNRGKNPDFLVSRGSEKFVIEAIWTAQRIGGATQKLLTASLVDAINSVPSPNFYLSVSVNKTGSAAPSQKRLKAGLIRWLADLDPDRVLGERGGNNIPLPTHTWEEAGWSVSFQAVPRSLERRGISSGRTIGVYPAMGWFDDGSELVFDAVRKKGKRYGDLSLPFIVAVGQATPFPEDEDIEISLYGSTFESGRSRGALTSGRLPDGYWTTPRNSGHARVSGVLVVDNPGPWNWAKNSPVLWCSPDPGSLKAPVLPTWATVQLVQGQVERQPPAAPAHTVLGLTAQWPTGDPFPRHRRKTDH